MTHEAVTSYLRECKAYSHILRYPRYQHIVDYVNEHTMFLDARATFKLRVELLLSGITSYPLCPVCKVNTVNVTSCNGKLTKTCGDPVCAKINRRDTVQRTSNERYGTDYPNQNRDVYENGTLRGMKEKYGKHYTQTDEYKQWTQKHPSSEEVKIKRKEGVKTAFEERGDEIAAKRKAGMREKYGVEHSLQNPVSLQKMKDTQFANHGGWYLSSKKAEQARLDAFGESNYFATDQFKEDIKKKRMDHHFQSPESYNRLIDREWLLGEYETRTICDISNELGVSHSCVWDYLVRHGVTASAHATNKVSYGENEIASLIEDLGFEVVRGSRNIIFPKEIDIYIPECNVAIEYNGVFWHTTRHLDDSKYHQNKAIACMEKGIQLIHVWSDDWNSDKKKILVDKIKAKLGVGVGRVFARKTTVITPTSHQVREFYNATHLQGFVRATHHIGLEYDGNMVACCSFHDKGNGIWDLNRFASSLSVVGGFSKILKHFKTNVECEWAEIYTFAHLDYSHGDLYEKTGFEKKKITVPGMWYVRGSERLRRERFMKKHLSRLVNEGVLASYDETLTEKQNMETNGHYQLFDSGSIRYSMLNKKKVIDEQRVFRVD